MKKIILTIIITVSLIISIAASIPKKQVKTKALVATTSWQAAQIINKETSDDWQLKTIVSQNVATSVGTHQSTGYNLTGDIILVFEKKE